MRRIHYERKLGHFVLAELTRREPGWVGRHCPAQHVFFLRPRSLDGGLSLPPSQSMRALRGFAETGTPRCCGEPHPRRVGLHLLPGTSRSAAHSAVTLALELLRFLEKSK